MPTSDPITCQNCDRPIERLGEAYIWLDRPVCKACFDRLSATRGVRYRGFWMPVALVASVAAVALGVGLGVTLSTSTARATVGASGKTVTGPSPSGRVAFSSGIDPSTATSGMTKDDALAIFRADRTWYGHWEKKNKQNPVRWGMTADDAVYLGQEKDKAVHLEQRWVLPLDGHVLVIMDDKTLTGFFIRTGRQKGYFTETNLPGQPNP